MRKLMKENGDDDNVKQTPGYINNYMYIYADSYLYIYHNHHNRIFY